MQNKIPSQYFSALDGLRFLAFLVVFGCHIFQGKQNIDFPIFINYIIHLFDFGYLAVDLFFLLSAFLISWWCFTEKKNHGNFNFKKYFIRRVLRIWPLYFLIILFCQFIILVQQLVGADISEMPNLFYYFSFTLNFTCLHNDQFLMVILWSISVEEQYYLFVGILHKFNKNVFLFTSILLLILSIIFRFYFYTEKLILHYHTFSVIGSFCIGNLLAYLLFYYGKHCVYAFNSTLVYFVYLGGFVLLFGFPFVAPFQMFVAFEKLIIGFFFSYILLDQAVFHKFFIQLKNAKEINYLGKISYGLYCYHGLAIGFFINFFPLLKIKNGWWSEFFLIPILSFFFIIILAHVSYKYFENYFLKFKQYFYQKDS